MIGEKRFCVHSGSMAGWGRRANGVLLSSMAKSLLEHADLTVLS